MFFFVADLTLGLLWVPGWIRLLWTSRGLLWASFGLPLGLLRRTVVVWVPRAGAPPLVK
jgi:hypothetical protein